MAVPLDVHDVAVEPARRLAEVDGGLLQRRDDRLHLVKLDALPRVLRAARREIVILARRSRSRSRSDDELTARCRSAP